MILLAVRFTKAKLSHGEEHDIGISLRDLLLSRVSPGEKFEFGVKTGGKPYIISSPVTYSISHTAGCVACAMNIPNRRLKDIPKAPDVIDSDGVYEIGDIGSGVDIGFDVELVDVTKPVKRLEGIAERFYNNNEKKYFKSAGDVRTAFYEIWTGKESIIKCSGVGMADIEKADTCNAAGDHRLFRLSLAKNGENFVSAVCIATL